MNHPLLRRRSDPQEPRQMRLAFWESLELGMASRDRRQSGKNDRYLQWSRSGISEGTKTCTVEPNLSCPSRGEKSPISGSQLCVVRMRWGISVGPIRALWGGNGGDEWGALLPRFQDLQGLRPLVMIDQGTGWTLHWMRIHFVLMVPLRVWNCLLRIRDLGTPGCFLSDHVTRNCSLMSGWGHFSI